MKQMCGILRNPFERLFRSEERCCLCGYDIHAFDSTWVNCTETYTVEYGSGSEVVRTAWHVRCYQEVYWNGWVH